MAATHGAINKVDELIAKVGETLRVHLTGLHSEYAIYKETHDVIMALPAVQNAIREGRETRETYENHETENKKEQVQIYISTIEALKLENDALRLQLSTSLKPNSGSNSNITLVIEESFGEEELTENEISGESEEEEEDDDDSGEPHEPNKHVTKEKVEDEEAEEHEQEEEAEEEEEEHEEEEKADAEEEVEVIEIQIKGKTYFTTNETSGVIYECLADGDIGDEVGEFKNGKPVFRSSQSKK